MFFPERIQSIDTADVVLEVGPGGTPHPRSDIFLERYFDSTLEAEEQRGRTTSLKTKRQVVFFDGMRFPFEDNTFDYVICSHVLEHVDDVDAFVSEIVRVGKKGYIEYPRVYYEYLYNFQVHLNILKYREDRLLWMKKADAGFDSFCAVQKLFYELLAAGETGFVDKHKSLFFEGFEWDGQVTTERIYDVTGVCMSPLETAPHLDALKHKPLASRIISVFKGTL